MEKSPFTPSFCVQLGDVSHYFTMKYIHKGIDGEGGIDRIKPNMNFSTKKNPVEIII